jgi:hypothetical protein
MIVAMTKKTIWVAIATVRAHLRRRGHGDDGAGRPIAA